MDQTALDFVCWNWIKAGGQARKQKLAIGDKFLVKRILSVGILSGKFYLHQFVWTSITSAARAATTTTTATATAATKKKIDNINEIEE